MARDLPEITEEEFTRIGGETPKHLLIEAALIELGGSGVNGSKFKREALKAAGWGYGKMTSFGSKPEAAAAAFNRIRQALSHAKSKEDLLSALGASA